MFRWAIFFLLITQTFCGAANAPSPLTFSPIVTELAQKIVEECVEEYRKMVEHRPHIRIISGPETSPRLTIQNGQHEFKYSWLAFHAILRKILMRNTEKNYRQIATSCKRSSDEPPVALFCDFVNCIAFVRRTFEALGRRKMTTNLGGAEEMLRGMESAGKIGRHKVLAAGQKSPPNFLIAEKVWTDGKRGRRIGIKIGHDFEPVDKQWAGQLLAVLLDNCKMYVFDVDKEHVSRNAYQMANITIKTVLLQGPTSSSSNNNQTEIDGTCATLYSGYPGKDLCVFAKKLAYLSVLSRAVSLPAGPLGCWPLKRDRSKAVRDCIATMRRRYDAERARMADFRLEEAAKRHFMTEFAFERLAAEVEEALTVQ